MDLEEIANHVRDTNSFHFPWGHWELPEVFGFQLTKYMVLELVVAALMILVFTLLAQRIKMGGAPKGLFWNFFEILLLFIRDEVVRPSIGKHDADKFLPFLWSQFFFILFCNLLGILPWAGSPTGSLSVTVPLAVIAFCAVVGTGVNKFGAGGYLKSLVPHLELPGAMGVVLIPMIFGIEVIGLFIRHIVLAVRLLANMFAGHLVLAVVVSFVIVSAKTFFILWAGITVSSVLGAALLTLLEIFVAFLQAYIFTFLTSLFIGMAVHPH